MTDRTKRTMRLTVSMNCGPNDYFVHQQAEILQRYVDYLRLDGVSGAPAAAGSGQFCLNGVTLDFAYSDEPTDEIPAKRLTVRSVDGKPVISTVE